MLNDAELSRKFGVEMVTTAIDLKNLFMRSVQKSLQRIHGQD
jgi:hypothetical protein